jgi:hypothetical protein
MKSIIRKSIWLSGAFFLMLASNSCLKNDDLVTADAKSGGLINPTGLVPYKLGLTPTFDIDLNVPKGPAIKTIHVSYYYMRMSDTTMSNVQTFDIDVSGANASEDVSKKLNYSWATIREGFTLPTDPQIPPTDVDTSIAKFIGDYWSFSYTTELTDGRVILNNQTTTVSVANFFAGTYDVELRYFHPSMGTYPDNLYGGVRSMKLDLVPTSPYDCFTFFGVWEDNHIFIHIDADYKVTITFDRDDGVSGVEEDPSLLNTYDPETGVIQIYYHYAGATGNRTFWEKFTPKN